MVDQVLRGRDAKVWGGIAMTGAQVTTLFSELVLEKPQTYEMADRAVGHFGDLERLYEALAHRR